MLEGDFDGRIWQHCVMSRHRLCSFVTVFKQECPTNPHKLPDTSHPLSRLVIHVRHRTTAKCMLAPIDALPPRPPLAARTGRPAAWAEGTLGSTSG